MDVRVKHKGGDKWEVSLPQRSSAITGAPKLRPRRTVHAPDEAAALAEGERLLAREYPAWRLGAGMDTAELVVAFTFRSQRDKRYSADTAHDYRLCVRRYMEPHFAMDADEVRAADLEELYAFLMKCGGVGGGQLGAATIHKLHSIVSAAFDWMEREGVVDSNPARAVHLAKEKKPKKRALTERELASVTSALRFAIAGTGPVDGAMGRVCAFGAWTALWTGARVGEVCGLLRGGVSFSKGRLTFDGSVTERGHLRRKDPKTASGVRGVRPGDEYMATLREFLRWQRESWLGPMFPITESTPVCCRADGGLIRPSEMSAAFKVLCLEAGVSLRPRESFHVLRHTNATLLLADGVNPDEARRRLGHAKVATTIDNYGHAMPGEDAAAAERLGQAIGKIEEGGVL